MARDENLILAASGTPLTTSGSSTAIDTEGGFFAIVRFIGGTITDADETFDVDIEASIDGGSNYYPIGSLPQIVGADDDIRIARPVYIPQFPPASQTATKVRLTWVAGGTTPSWPVDVFIEPMTSLGVPQVDEDLSEGLAALT
jgi:hypothetical protein